MDWMRTGAENRIAARPPCSEGSSVHHCNNTMFTVAFGSEKQEGKSHSALAYVPRQVVQSIDIVQIQLWNLRMFFAITMASLSSKLVPAVEYLRSRYHELRMACRVQTASML